MNADGWKLITSLEHEQTVARRQMVMRHPPVAGLLAKSPLSYAEPAHWNGWIPPEIWGECRNDSPRRAALIVIAAEAQRHEDEGCKCRQTTP